MATFTKADLIERVSELNDIPSKTAATRVVAHIIDTVIEEVANGNEVKLAGFINMKPAVRNTKAGESFGKKYPASTKNIVKLKAAAPFEAALN